MDDEKKSILDKRYWVLGIGLVAISFVLGMLLQQSLDKRSLNSFVKKYELKDGGYLVADESFAAVYGNSTEMKRFFQDTIIPALKGNPACFANNRNIEVKNGTI